MPFILRHTSAVSSVEASSTTTTSTSVPAASALSTARGNRCGRLCVGMIRLMLAIGSFKTFCEPSRHAHCVAPSAPTASRFFPLAGAGQFDSLTAMLESSRASTHAALPFAAPPESSNAGIRPRRDSPQSDLTQDGDETLRSLDGRGRHNHNLPIPDRSYVPAATLPQRVHTIDLGSA